MSLNLIKNGSLICAQRTLTVVNGSGVDNVLNNLSVNFNIPDGISLHTTDVGTISGDSILLGNTTCEGKNATDNQGAVCPIINECKVVVNVCFIVTDAEIATTPVTITGVYAWDGCVEDKPILPIVKEYEDCSCFKPCLVDTVVVNGNGTGTITQNDGTTKDFLCVIPGVDPGTIAVDNGNNTYTINNPDGTVVTIDINEIDMDINSIVANGAIITFTAEDGTETIFDICQIVADNCNATMVEDPDNPGTYIFTDNAGNTSTVEGAVSAFESNGDGTATHYDGLGGSFTVCEICPTLLANEDGSFTFTGADGIEVIIEKPVTSVFNNITNDVGFGTINSATHEDGNGNSVIQTETVIGVKPDPNSTKNQILVAEDGTEYCIPKCTLTTVLGLPEAPFNVKGCGPHFVNFRNPNEGCMVDGVPTPGVMISKPGSETGEFVVFLDSGGNAQIIPTQEGCTNGTTGTVKYCLDCGNGVVVEVEEQVNVAPEPIGDIRIKKEIDLTRVKPGDTVTITLTVWNEGGQPVPGPITDVQVLDSLASIFTNPTVTQIPTGWVDNSSGSNVDVTFVGPLNTGSTETITITAVIDLNIAEGWLNENNTAYITGDDGTGPNTTLDQDSDSVVETPEPCLKLTKWMTGVLDLGETITVGYGLENCGPTRIDGLQIIDPTTLDGTPITLTGGPVSLPPMGTDTTTFVGTFIVTQGMVDAGLVSNQAIAEGTDEFQTDVSAISDNDASAGDSVSGVDDGNGGYDESGDSDPSVLLAIPCCKEAVVGIVRADWKTNEVQIRNESYPENLLNNTYTMSVNGVLVNNDPTYTQYATFANFETYEDIYPPFTDLGQQHSPTIKVDWTYSWANGITATQTSYVGSDGNANSDCMVQMFDGEIKTQSATCDSNTIEVELEYRYWMQDTDCTLVSGSATLNGVTVASANIVTNASGLTTLSRPVFTVPNEEGTYEYCVEGTLSDGKVISYCSQMVIQCVTI